MPNTWQKYLPSKDAVWIAATLLLGNGAVWGFLQFTQGREQQELVRVQRIGELRAQRDELYHQIIDVDSHIGRLIACNPNETNVEATDDLYASDHRASLLKEDFVATEKTLAKLEGRATRDVQLQFARPGPPHAVVVRMRVPKGSNVYVEKPDSIKQHPDGSHEFVVIGDSIKHPDCAKS